MSAENLLTGDEYIALLESRRAEWESTHDPRKAAEAAVARIKAEYPNANPQIQPRFHMRPLLEWFIRDGDEDLVDPAVYAPATPQPKPSPKPRKYRSVESLRVERDRVQAQLDAIHGRDCGDNAVVNLSPNSRNRAARVAGRRRFAQLDRDLERHTQLTTRLTRLNGRIASAEARENLKHPSTRNRV